RKKLLQSHAVDVVVSIGPNFFYTVTLPCTLWFLDRGKVSTKRKDKVLFIDARHIFRQIDRAHRDFTPEQSEFISNIVRLYREEEIETEAGSRPLMKENFPKGKYVNVPGLCGLMDLSEIDAQGWSLNPGRYVGVAEQKDDGLDFAVRLEELREELERLNSSATELQEQIGESIGKILDQDAGS